MYYDCEVRIPVEGREGKASRRFFEGNGESAKTNKTHDTMVNSKMVSEFEMAGERRGGGGGKGRREPMTPKDLMKMVNSRSQYI